jgi:hypothetical protein
MRLLIEACLIQPLSANEFCKAEEIAEFGSSQAGTDQDRDEELSISETHSRSEVKVQHQMLGSGASRRRTLHSQHQLVPLQRLQAEQDVSAGKSFHCYRASSGTRVK